MIEWLEDVEDDLARRDMPVVVGISAGGHVAMAAAARNPGLVSGLVALDTPMVLPRDRLLADDIQAVIRPDEDDPEWADVVHYLTRGDLDTFFEGFPEQAPDPAITCPILLVGGDQSEGSLLTPDDLRDAEQVLPDASSITIDNVGHTLGIDTDACILIDAIEPFLTQLATK